MLQFSQATYHNEGGGNIRGALGNIGPPPPHTDTRTPNTDNEDT